MIAHESLYRKRIKKKKRVIQVLKQSRSAEHTCFPFVTESGRWCLLELVDPILLDMDPSNLWDSWCWWSAIDKACLCKNSSSASNFLCDRFILLLLDPLSLVSFFDIQINRLPIVEKRLLNKTQKSFGQLWQFKEKNQEIFLENGVVLK